MNKRTPYFDIVKGIAINLVIIGHCIQYGSGEAFFNERTYFNSLPFRAIYSFHMSLFMLVSGYLFWNSCAKNEWKIVLKSKIQGLGIPIIAWGTIDFAIDLVSGAGRGTAQIVKTYIWDIIGAPWFLWATFMCSIALLILRVLTHDKTWILLLSIPVILIIPDKYNLVWFKFMYPYFLVGYLWNKHGCNNRVKELLSKQSLKAGILIGLVTLWIILLQFFHHDQFIYTTRMQFLGKSNPFWQLGIDLFRWVIGYIGSGVVLLAATYIKGGRPLLILGQKSLGIYLVNIYVNLYLLKPLTASFSPNILVNLLETVVVMAVCFTGTWLLERNSITNKVFLGGR